MNSSISSVHNLHFNNRALLLAQLRLHATSRVALAQKTGLAKSAVTTIINELMQENIVQECSVSASSHAGRPAILLDIMPRELFAVGLIINRSSTLLCAVDLKNNVLQMKQIQTEVFHTQSDCTSWIYQTLDDWFTLPETPLGKCIGISIGAAGPVNRTCGIIQNPPDFERFHNYHIVDLLRKKYSLPIVLENVAVPFAQAEYLYGVMQNYRSTLFVFWVENGIGSVLLTDGIVYRGFGGFAGEIGHTCVNPTGIRCSCGGIGCLEVYLKKETVEARFGSFSLREVMNNAMSGQPKSMELIDYYVCYLGTALSNAINMFDPDSICIYMSDNYKSAYFFQRLSEYIEHHTVICKNHHVDLISASIPGVSPTSAAVAPIQSLFFQSGGNRLMSYKG